MTLARILALLLAAAAAPLLAEPAAPSAQAALVRLDEARQALVAARGARNRVAALTRVVEAYELGLAALRDGLRQAAVEESALTASLSARGAGISRLLGALESLESTPDSLLLLHPAGPIGAVRSGMLMAAAVPELQGQAADLRARLEGLRQMQSLQEAAYAALEQGLGEVQQARSELSLAIQNRSDLPPRLSDDAAAVARLAEAADTLQAFADGLVRLHPEGQSAAPEVALPLVLPVQGRILRRFGEEDAAGIARPGWVIATAPLALVTSPLPATIRYLGPLLDYGNVMVLEPGPDLLLVLAGLGQVYGAAGQVVPAGAPVGMMGGTAPSGREFMAEAQDGGGGGAERPETLYLELRRGNRPIDPATWFAGTKDGTE